MLNREALILLWIPVLVVEIAPCLSLRLSAQSFLAADY